MFVTKLVALGIMPKIIRLQSFPLMWSEKGNVKQVYTSFPFFFSKQDINHK